jgi:hypothetical protein
VLGAVKHYGYDPSVFFDCRKNLEGAIANLARAIDASSADNPLYFIVAGPMEAPYLAIQKALPEKRKFVYCISHSRWNDGFAAKYMFTHTKRSVIEQGVNWVQIKDQNRLLSLSPYGKPGPPESFAAYHWMRDSSDPKVPFLWDRMIVSTRPDPSDAGMAYFLATGDEEADPAKLRRLLEEKTVPPPTLARKQIRLEAENFRELQGYEVEDANDRTASHRLQVKSTGGAAASIRTPFAEPYAGSGRFDLDVRYFDEPSGLCRLTLLVSRLRGRQRPLEHSRRHLRVGLYRVVQRFQLQVRENHRTSAPGIVRAMRRERLRRQDEKRVVVIVDRQPKLF